jgi:hypothetical protein
MMDHVDRGGTGVSTPSGIKFLLGSTQKLCDFVTSVSMQEGFINAWLSLKPYFLSLSPNRVSISVKFSHLKLLLANGVKEYVFY